jgi:hypothetical protein
MTRSEEFSAGMPRPDEKQALHPRPGRARAGYLAHQHRPGRTAGRFVMRGDMTGLLCDMPVERR